MSSKIIIAFVVAFALFSLLDGIAAGSGGIAVTRLSTALSSSATSINVESTGGFLRSDYVRIGDETIAYTGKSDTTFNSVTRGFDGTTASAYALHTKVYSAAADPLNAVLGYNIASTGSTVGTIDIAIFLGRFWVVTIPKLVSWDFAILKDTTVGQYFRLVLQLISAGFIVYIAIIIIQALGGILQGIFTRGA